MTSTVPKRPSFTLGARSATHIPPTPAEQREMEADIRRDRIAQHGPAMIALIAEAKAFRKTWGRSTTDGWLFDAVWGAYLSESDEVRIRAAMKSTLTRAAERAAQALAGPYVPKDGDNHLSDAHVAAGIRHLSIDGLSAYDKSLGDCCNALLDIDYAGAIAMARGIIGKYSTTLRKAGVLGAARGMSWRLSTMPA